ncbi:germ cell nuclear acidic protein isoform X2 [Entelurus aequoreus]|uniref:germ cell nuclear acidic protein isoform X2 n=1 Tax=Entelurus aequoreus TaxID=161455 RepID=UPI002B1E8EEC|nr:germ cell nuclear acidic protein isoform X2 [Entelurus aequoreus]
MMSYLWILLVGSLLAGCANTQDDESPMEEATASATLMPDSEVQAEIEADGASEDTAEKALTDGLETEPTEAAAREEVNPAEGEAEPEAPSEADPEPPSEADPEPGLHAEVEPEREATAEEAEPETPAEEEADSPVVNETEAAAEGEGEPEVLPEGESETEAPATESEDATTTQGPAADPEVKEPEAEPHIPNVDEQPSASTEVPPAHKEGGSEVDDTAVQHGKEEPASAGDEGEAAVNTELKFTTDGGFDLEDALSAGGAQDTPTQSGRSHSAGSGAHVAEATGEVAEDEETNSGTVAAILCAMGVAVVGAATGYYTYQKKKLCFRTIQEEDPEAARKADAGEVQSDPQVLSNLLNSS